MFCDVCGDQVTASYPIKLTFHDKTEITLNTCIECYDDGEIMELDVARKHQIAKMLNELIGKTKKIRRNHTW